MPRASWALSQAPPGRRSRAAPASSSAAGAGSGSGAGSPPAAARRGSLGLLPRSPSAPVASHSKYAAFEQNPDWMKDGCVAPASDASPPLVASHSKYSAFEQNSDWMKVGVLTAAGAGVAVAAGGGGAAPPPVGSASPGFKFGRSLGSCVGASAPLAALSSRCSGVEVAGSTRVVLG